MSAKTSIRTSIEAPQVEIRKGRFGGVGLFAVQPINKNQPIAEFDGKIYGWYSKFWNDYLEDHCLQIAERKWRNSNGIANLINHSCDPNCGIKGLYQIVAFKNIKAGEELTFDYEMSEDCIWLMRCRCGAANCRQEIGAFRNMPAEIRNKYKGYISEWLVKKYNLNV